MSAGGQPLIRKGVQHASDKRRRAILVALDAVYWLAQEEIPNRKYKSLLALLRRRKAPDASLLQIGGNATYDSPDIFNQLLSTISTVLEKQLIADLTQSPWVAIGTDESTDRSSEKHLVIIVRFISRLKTLRTTFLRLKAIANGRAVTIFDSVRDALAEFGVPMSKVVGLGTDGASVMASDLNGVTGLIHQAAPHCVCVHCCCHRLNLAVSQACNSIPNMEIIQSIISGVYNYIQGSEVRLHMFGEIAALLEVDEVKFKRLYDIRWLSMGESVNAIIRNFEPLMVLLSQEADKGDPTAIGLHSQLSSYKFMALLHLTADILGISNQLSRVFQYKDISFSVLRYTVSFVMLTM